MNDMERLAQTQVGREINRHIYSWDEVNAALARPVVQSLLKLIRFRNEHPAFEGDFSLMPAGDTRLVMRWDRDAHWAELRVDLATSSLEVRYEKDGSPQTLDLGITPVA